MRSLRAIRGIDCARHYASGSLRPKFGVNADRTATRVSSRSTVDGNDAMRPNDNSTAPFSAARLEAYWAAALASFKAHLESNRQAAGADTAVRSDVHDAV